MNVDDLREELHRRADRVAGSRHEDRLAGVRSKVTATRRERAAGSVAAVATAAVAALVIVPQVGQDTARPNRSDPVAPAPSSTSATQPGTEPLVFPASIDGDTLIGSKLTRPGQKTLTWRVTLDNLDVLAALACQRPEGISQDRLQWWSINGRRLSGQSCLAEFPPEEIDPLPFPWRSFGVRPGKPFTISSAIWRTLGEGQGEQRIQVEGAQFGVALYERTGERVYPDGVELTVIRDADDGHRYRLMRFRTKPVKEGRELSLTVPATHEAMHITYG